jgi:acyl transferase domain-containing protein
MSSRPDTPDESSRLKRALLALQKLQSTIDALQSERHEPIAIIGLGCRFPGANTPEEFWRLLSEGRDAISEVPPSRWDVRQYYDPDPRAPGKIATPFGGFIDDVDLFDAHFFGIAPREAASLDPQQRLLLEVSWEALEQAGIAPDSLAGSAAGVFVGISSNDFAQIVMSCDPAEIDHYLGSGNARSVAAGRLSYVLGLKGPSLSIDTACSSSLVAVHLACESLQRQECHLALAGGVNLLFSPEVSISHSRAQMLAPDGRCKTFDASADGFVRAEGCGVVVLKPLATAIADRDNVLAVILGSAVNHDGRTSALTVPSGPSQEAVIRTALRNAGIDGSSVSYLEAHGTGTRLGDPIEVGALAAVLCQGRDAANPLTLGSVKTNIGHLEAGAGIAGLIKTVLAGLHRQIPAHLHVRELNPLIPWDRLPLRVATTSMPWQTRGERRIAGISSFGFSGTNAHVVVAEAPAPAGQASVAAVPVNQSLLVLSAKTEPALRRLAGRYVEHLSATSIAAADVAYSAAIGRAHFAHRLAVTAPSTELCREQLEAFLGGRPGPGVSSGHILIGDRPRVAFLFSGQGSQYPGMGSDLYREHAVFRASVDRCESILKTWIDRPLTDLLFRAPADVLNCTKYTQPALFAFEYALAELWRSWGVEPEALLGHSVGEYVAACIAGVFSLEDGLMLIARRAALMQSVTAAGEMVAVLTDEAQVASLVSSYPTEVSVAAINGPRNVVISGARDRVRQLVQDLTAAGVTTVPLAVSHAFHSPHMDAVLAEFGEVSSRVRFAAASIDIVSNVTGEIASEEMASPDYWCHHLRQTVRFAAGVRTLERLGCNTCIEIGPKPVLIDLARQSFAPGTGTWLASLKYGQPDNQQILRSLGTMFTRGATIDWTRFYGIQRRNRVTLPLYPFERQRFWVAPSTNRGVVSASTHQPKEVSHPLLGCRRWVGGSDELRYEARLAPDAPLYLGDHHVFDTPSLPASAYIEMALAAGVAWFDTHALTLHNVTFVRALRLDEAKLVQLVLRSHSDGRMIFHIYSRSEANVDAPTTLDASGEIGPATDDAADRAATLTRYRGEPGEPVPLEWFNLEFNRRGVRFGPAFRALTQIWRGRDHVLATVEAPAAVAEELGRYHFHPALLDACCRTSAVFTFAQTEELLLQVGIERLHYYRRPGSRLWASSRVRGAGSPGREEWVADCEVFDETGNCCLAIEGQSARRAVRELLDRDVEQRAAQQYELQWVLKPNASARTPAPLPAPDAVAQAIHAEIAAVAADPSLIEYGRFLLQLDRLANAYVLNVFANIGRTWRPGERFATVQIAEELGIVDRHSRLFERLLEMLSEAGWLRRVGDHWEVAALAVSTAPDELHARLSAEFPEAVTELSLVRDSGERLADILRGQVDPLDFMFPKGEVNRINRLYENTRGAVATHAVLRKAVAKAVETGGARRTVLRVLEIGGGAGATTASVLDVFDPLRTEYTFTDVSPRFVTHAQQRFGGYPFLSYRRLDIEQSPLAQGFVSDRFDLVIAANVLHASRDLRQAAGYVHELLAPNGILMVLEGTSKSPWLDLVLGLLPEWWRFADTDLRPSHPLISSEAWERLLAAQGFSHPRTMSEASGGPLSRQAAIVAQKPGTATSPHAFEAGGWLILADRGGVGARVADLLMEEGASCHLLQHETTELPSAAWDPEIHRRQTERLRAAICEFATTHTPLRGIVYLWSLEATRAIELSIDALQHATMEDAATLLMLLRAITDEALQDVVHSARIWLVTRDAQAAGSAPKLTGMASAPVWGIGKVIALEHPERLGGMIDLSADATSSDPATIVHQLVHGDGEDLVAFRGGERLVARLAHRRYRSGRPLSIRADATYLVTGGLGALGLEIVSWLTDHGARRVCVVGRNGAHSDAARAAVRRLRNAEVEIDVVQADIGDPAQVRRLFAAMDGRPPIRGIVHAAGVLASGPLSQLDPAALRSAFAAKISGTWLLHQFTQDAALDFFVLCSSMVAVWGGKGHADYVAANSFLDACAHYRRAIGLPALSIDWGPLEGGGMLPADSIRSLSRIGVSTRPITEAGGVVGDLLGSGAVQVVVADIDWALFRRAYEVRGRRPLFETVGDESGRESVGPRPAMVVSLLDAAPPNERDQMLRDLVQRTLAEVLGLTTAQISDPRMGFFNLGMDSLTALEFRDRLAASLGVSLPSTLALDYSTVESVAAYLLATISRTASPGPASVSVDHEPVDDAVRRLQQLSEEEVEALLLKKLEAL